MTKKQASLTTIMIVQQLEDDFWPKWSDKEPISEAREGDCRLLLESLVERFDNAGVPVKEAYGIIHDQDTHEIWMSERKQFETVLKSPHVHLLFKFEFGATISKLSEIAGIDIQFLEKAKSGRYGYDNFLAYLIHAKDEKKFQYDPTRVVSLKGESFLEIYKRQKALWEKGRAIKNVQEAKLNVDWLVEQILEGKVTRGNIMLTDEYYKIYGLHKQRINEAFDTFGEKKCFRTIEALEAKKFKKTILFISGISGSGKTVLAKELITHFILLAEKFEENWDFCLTAATNAFDDYNGQDILFLDDIRGDSLTASDWLKLLDPYSISPISARYRNRMGAAKVIIITTVKSPEDFFRISKHNYSEDLGQFIRRLDCSIEVNLETFKLSKPIKNENFKCNQPLPDISKKAIDHTKLIESVSNVSYILDDPETYSKETVVQKLIETITENMHWCEKKGFSDTDQSLRKKP